MQQKKSSSSDWLLFVTSIALSWWLILLSVFFASLDRFSSPNVDLDMPVKEVSADFQTPGLNAKQLPGAFLKGAAPLIVVSSSNIFIIKVADFRSGLEKNAVRFPYNVLDEKLILDISKNLNENFKVDQLKTVVILPSKEFKMNELVIFAGKIKKIESVDHIVLSSNKI